MEGWELDGSIYPVARQYMGLQQLEDSGALVGFAPPFHPVMNGFLQSSLTRMFIHLIHSCI